MSKFLPLFVSLVAAAGIFGQPKSTIEFFDTTGAESVSKIGWTGSKDNGNFFIKTPNDTTGVSLKSGNMNVTGTVTAKKFIGDGSGLTNLPSGVMGATGPVGPAGPIGPVGPTGATGLKGEKGDSGVAGPIGPIGPAGPTGVAGPAGAIGPAGPAGAAGTNGTNGAAGATGPTGPAGPAGPSYIGVDWTTIAQTSIDVRTAAVNVGSVTLTAPTAGYVVVRFDGNGIGSSGDRIVLAASNVSATWGGNDGSVGFMGDGNGHPFSHSRVYAVSAGANTFYAVVQNYVNTGGNGLASIYATLTAEFFPNRY